MIAQRRPGLPPRRHNRGIGTCFSWQAPLNEGRGFHPGDTSLHRPGHGAPVALNEGRGFHPGDTRGRYFRYFVFRNAQRRPGLPPRRHRPPGPTWPTRSSLNEGRGFHPGDTRGRYFRYFVFRNAQRRPGLPPRRHRPPGPTWPTRSSLNEGRGFHPGDTQHPRRRASAVDQRSTKAGASTPATLRVVSIDATHEICSTKAGASTPATPQLGRG